jgi:hypothetical protein
VLLVRGCVLSLTGLLSQRRIKGYFEIAASFLWVILCWIVECARLLQHSMVVSHVPGL